MNRLTASKVNWYTDALKRHYCRYNDGKYDKETIDVILELMVEIYKAAPIGDDGYRQFWIPVDRGDISDFGYYKELVEDGACEEEFEDCKKYWLSLFPNERMWFLIKTAEHENYRAISLNEDTIVNQDITEYGYSGDNEKEFFKGIIIAVKETIAMMKEGTYNDTVKNEVAYNYRTGTIQLKALCELIPKYNESIYLDLTEDEINEFLAITDCGEDFINGKELPHMTAGIFYDACATGYRANNYSFTELSPKEQYYKNADGRDGGLKEIDINSAEAFEEWLNSDMSHGSHVYEVRRGGIHLYPYKTDKGYYFTLSGSYIGRYVETIRFYMGLVKADIPVMLYETDVFRKRLQGTEKVGIVSVKVLPICCNSRFPEEKIGFFEHLPEDNRDEIIKRIQWQPISDSYLIDKSINEDDKIIANLMKELESVDLNNCLSHEEVCREFGITAEDFEGFEDIEFDGD